MVTSYTCNPINARLAQYITHNLSPGSFTKKQNVSVSLPAFATNNISPDCSLALAPFLELVHPDSLQHPYQALHSGWRPKPQHHQSDAVPRCAHLPWQAASLHAAHQPAAALLLSCLSTSLLFSLSFFPFSPSLLWLTYLTIVASYAHLFA